MTLGIRKLSYALGAEVIGVDSAKPLNDGTFREIRSALTEHGVLVLRGQLLTPQQHVMFSRGFGELDRNEGHRNGHPECAEIIVNNPKVMNMAIGGGKASSGRVVGEEWHTDRSHLPAAAAASLLLAREVPEIGGDTMFANMYRAYETLSDGMKKLLEGLYGVHMDGSLNPCAAHPIVRVLDSGRKALYVNEQVGLFVGMTREESKPLIQYLTCHAVRPQNVYRHRWRKGDLVMWDNRCTLHVALGDYDRSQVRHMERTTVNGAVSGYVYDGPRE